MQSRICNSQHRQIIGCVSLKRIPILLTVLVIIVVGLSLISVPVAAEAVGTWKSIANYPTNIWSQSCVVSGGFIYCVGGDIGAYGVTTNAVSFAQLSSSGVGTWKSTNSYPTDIWEQSCVVSGGFIYCVGGETSVSPYVTGAVYFAKLSSSGVGTWKSTTSYPTTESNQSCVVSGGFIYCVGGYGGGWSSVYFTKLSSIGVGKWKSTTTYPTVIWSQSCVVSGGYIYCVAGWSFGSPSATDALYFAKLSSKGVGTWESTTSYPIIIGFQSCVVNGSILTGVYVYCVGGWTGVAYAAVYFASV